MSHQLLENNFLAEPALFGPSCELPALVHSDDLGNSPQKSIFSNSDPRVIERELLKLIVLPRLPTSYGAFSQPSTHSWWRSFCSDVAKLPQIISSAIEEAREDAAIKEIQQKCGEEIDSLFSSLGGQYDYCLYRMADSNDKRHQALTSTYAMHCVGPISNHHFGQDSLLADENTYSRDGYRLEMVKDTITHFLESVAEANSQTSVLKNWRHFSRNGKSWGLIDPQTGLPLAPTKLIQTIATEVKKEKEREEQGKLVVDLIRSSGGELNDDCQQAHESDGCALNAELGEKVNWTKEGLQELEATEKASRGLTGRLFSALNKLSGVTGSSAELSARLGILQRATSELLSVCTTAGSRSQMSTNLDWARHYIEQHPESHPKGRSMASDWMQYMKTCKELFEGNVHHPVFKSDHPASSEGGPSSTKVISGNTSAVGLSLASLPGSTEGRQLFNQHPRM